MKERAILNRQMNRTGQALAGAPVRVAFDLLWESTQKVYNLKADGFCTAELFDGAYCISIDARLLIGRTYEVFLHETAHAFLNARNIRLPDQEAGAREVGGIWACWNAPRTCKDFTECMQWLARLQHYHTQATGQPRRFYKGKNAGRALPGMGKQWQITR